MAARIIAVVAALLGAFGCDSGDGGRDGDVSDVGGDRPEGMTDDADQSDGSGDDAEQPEPGQLTLVATTGEILLDRLCDLDGNGDGDNAIADLGVPGATLAAAAISTGLADKLATDTRLLVHFPWLDDVSGPSDGDARLLSFMGMDTDLPIDASDDFSGVEPYWAIADSLDVCGEPDFTFLSLSIGSGEVQGEQGMVPILVNGIVFAIRNASVSGTIAREGASATLDVCGILLIDDLGEADSPVRFGDLTMLEVMLAGGQIMGIAGVPGVTPDLDLDGDGVERFELDDSLAISSCIDGDRTVVAGRDCWADPRFADGFALNFRLEMIAAHFAGLQPGWEQMTRGRCNAPPLPEESLWSSPAASPAEECAGAEEPCDPLAAGNQCCDEDHRCSGADLVTYRCLPACTPTSCEYGSNAGYCRAHTDLPEGQGACWPLSADFPWEYCDVRGTGCATEYGVTEGTACLTYGDPWTGVARRGCTETCPLSPTGCDVDGYQCTPSPLPEGGLCVADAMVR